MTEFTKNPQGFVVIDMNLKSDRTFQSTDACVKIDFLGHEISFSTGGSVLRGSLLVEHSVIDPEGREHMIRGSVQDAIMFVIQREQGRNNNAFVEALNARVEEV